MRNYHLILTGLTLNIILLSLNRLTPFTLGTLAPFEFLRILDFNAMLPIPLMAILLYWLLRREILNSHPFKKTISFLILDLILISGIYFFGAGSGTHEVTNYLHSRFCSSEISERSLCNIIKFTDDEFSHYVYYAGFVLMNVALMFIEHKFPRKSPVSKKDLFLISLNSLFIGLGIFANLAFEEIGIDLWVFGSVMLLAIYLLFFDKRKMFQLPATFYFAVAYTLGVIGTILYKSLKNN